MFDDDREVADHLQALIGVALARVEEAPNSDHHAMTLAGIVAFYTTHPGARDPRACRTARIARRKFAPTIWLAVAVMQTWRLAKTLKSLARRASSGATTRSAGIRLAPAG